MKLKMPRVGRRPAMGQSNKGHPAEHAKGRHRAGSAAHRRPDDGEGDWTPTPAQWDRLAAGQTVNGVRLVAAPRQRRSDAGARAQLEARARQTGRPGDSFAHQVSRQPAGLHWREPASTVRGSARRPPAPVPARDQPTTGMWRR